MQMSITPEEIIFVGLFVQIKSITVLEFSGIMQFSGGGLNDVVKTRQLK